MTFWPHKTPYRTYLWVWIAVVLLFTSLAHRAAAEEFRILGQPFPPFSMHEEGKVTGFSMDLLREVFAEAGFDITKSKIIPVPFKRLYVEVSKAERRIGLAVGMNEERLPLFKWVGPYYRVPIGMIGKRSKDYEISDFEDLLAHRVGTQLNTMPEQTLIARGFPVSQIDRSTNPDESLHKLMNERIDMTAQSIPSLAYVMQSKGVDTKDYINYFTLRDMQLYFVISPTIADHERIQLQVALDRVMRKPVYLKLIEKYKLDSFSADSPIETSPIPQD